MPEYSKGQFIEFFPPKQGQRNVFNRVAGSEYAFQVLETWSPFAAGQASATSGPLRRTRQLTHTASRGPCAAPGLLAGEMLTMAAVATA